MLDLTMSGRMYRKELEIEGNSNVEETIEKQFASWFHKHVSHYYRIFNKAMYLIEVVFTIFLISLYRLQNGNSLMEKM
jgi:hypothetical protein